MADGVGHRDEQGNQLKPQPESRYCCPGAEVHRDDDDGPVMKPRSGQVRSGRTGPGQTKPWQRFNWGPHGAASLIPHRSKQVGSGLFPFAHRPGRQAVSAMAWWVGWDRDDGLPRASWPVCIE